MKVSWHKAKSEEILIKCPICGHQTAPPTYPYCSHTVFVYVDGSGADPFFDYMRSDFAIAYKKSNPIKPTKKNLASLDLPGAIKIFEITESGRFYPSTIIVAHEQEG